MKIFLMYGGLVCSLGVSARKFLLLQVLESVVPPFLLCLKAVLAYPHVKTASDLEAEYEKN